MNSRRVAQPLEFTWGRRNLRLARGVPNSPGIFAAARWVRQRTVSTPKSIAPQKMLSFTPTLATEAGFSAKSLYHSSPPKYKGDFWL